MLKMKIETVLPLSLLLFACSHAPKSLPPQPLPGLHETAAQIINQARIEKYSETLAVDVFYATNRESAGDVSLCNNQSYGIKTDKQLNFGVCRVNVPKRHATGQIEVAADSRADTHRYFRVLNQKNFDAENFEKVIKNNPAKEVLVFIHGFNVRFQDAVFRASQIAYDLKFQGPVILFSWPAGADSSFLGKAMVSRTYESNKLNAEQSVLPAIEFFKLIGNYNIKVNIIVHSMGHQIAIPALTAISQEAGLNFKLDELVLNAPDFDLREFKKVSGELKKIATRITLYCSYNDSAMLASETYNGRERLGACEKFEGVDVINVSEVDSSSYTPSLGHGYYSSRAVLTDVAQLMMGIEAEKRLFIRRSEPNSTEDFYLRP